MRSQMTPTRGRSPGKLFSRCCAGRSPRPLSPWTPAMCGAPRSSSSWPASGRSSICGSRLKCRAACTAATAGWDAPMAGGHQPPRSPVERRRRHAATVPPFTPALEGCNEDMRGLRLSAVAVPVAALLRDVLELADHPIDLVIGHAPNQRGGEDACDVVVGFHEGWIALARADLK